MINQRIEPYNPKKETAMKKLLQKFAIKWSELMTLSFRGAVSIPFSSYYKLKPDNGYWNEQNRLAFWYRLVIFTAVLLIFSASTSIWKQESPWSVASGYYKQASVGLPSLFKHFPMRFIAYPRMWASRYNRASLAEIETALSNDAMRVSVFTLIKQSEEIRFSELGGAIFQKGKRLDFYILDNPNRLIAVDMNNALGNEKEIANKFRQYRDVIRDKFEYEPVIRKILAILEKNPDNKIFQKKILELFIFLSTFDHQIDFDETLELFYDGTKGAYAGNFHVHQFGDQPSPIDLENSYVEDKCVISRDSKTSATVYWLRKGQILAKKNYKR